MKSVLFTFLLVFCSLSVQAQYVIKGKVIGADDGLPLPQVIVKVTGTEIVTVTSAAGEFIIEAASRNITLTLRFLGYRTQVVEPNFEEVNLIRLKPDCIKDTFYSPHLKLMGALDIANSQVGGRLELRLPYWLNYHIITTHEYYPFSESEHVYRADALMNTTLKSCSLDLFIRYQYQQFQLPSEGFHINTSMISTEWIPGESKYIFGIGFGRNQLPEQRENLLGIHVGYEKYWRISNRFYLPLSVTATRWNGFWDFQMATSRSFRSLESRLEFQHINGFNQLRLSIGFYIRLRKLHESEREMRKTEKERRKQKRSGSKGSESATGQ